MKCPKETLRLNPYHEKDHNKENRTFQKEFFVIHVEIFRIMMKFHKISSR